MINYLSFDAHDPQQSYFLTSSKNIYVNSVLLNIGYFVLLKILHLLFFAVNKKFKILQSIYIFIKMQTKWWTLIIAIIEMNIITLVYNSSLQFLLPSFYSFVNKPNFVFSVLSLFAVVFYILCFYLLIYQY